MSLSKVDIFQWGAKRPVTNLGKFTDTLTYKQRSIQDEIHVQKGDMPVPCLLSNVTAQLMGLIEMTCNVTAHH